MEHPKRSPEHSSDYGAPDWGLSKLDNCSEAGFIQTFLGIKILIYIFYDECFAIKSYDVSVSHKFIHFLDARIQTHASQQEHPGLDSLIGALFTVHLLRDRRTIGILLVDTCAALLCMHTHTHTYTRTHTHTFYV